MCQTGRSPDRARLPRTTGAVRAVRGEFRYRSPDHQCPALRRRVCPPVCIVARSMIPSWFVGPWPISRSETSMPLISTPRIFRGPSGSNLACRAPRCRPGRTRPSSRRAQFGATANHLDRARTRIHRADLQVGRASGGFSGNHRATSIYSRDSSVNRTPRRSTEPGTDFATWPDDGTL